MKATVQRISLFAIALGSISILSGPALFAEDAKGPLSSLNACRTIADPAQRVVCYDSAVDGLNASVARKDVTIVDKATVKEARRGLFGFNIGKIRLFGGGDEKEGAVQEEETLTAKVTSAKRFGDGTWRFVLETGAVWETLEPPRGSQEPKAGGQVQIEKASLGSYMVQFGRGMKTRAKRVN